MSAMDSGGSNKRAREESAVQEFKYLVFFNTEESWGMRIFGIRELTPVQQKYFSEASAILTPPFTNSLCAMILLGLFGREDFEQSLPLAAHQVAPCEALGENVGSMFDYLEPHVLRADAFEELSAQPLPTYPVLVYRLTDFV